MFLFAGSPLSAKQWPAQLTVGCSPRSLRASWSCYLLPFDAAPLCVHHHYHHHHLEASFVASGCVFVLHSLRDINSPILWCALLSFWADAFRGCMLLEQGYKLRFLRGLSLSLVRCQDLSNVQPSARLDVNTAQFCPQIVFLATCGEFLFSFVLQFGYTKKLCFEHDTCVCTRYFYVDGATVWVRAGFSSTPSSNV